MAGAEAGSERGDTWAWAIQEADRDRGQHHRDTMPGTRRQPKRGQK